MERALMIGVDALRVKAEENRRAGARYRRLYIGLLDPAFLESAQMCQGAELAYTHSAEMVEGLLTFAATLKGGEHHDV